MKYYFYTGTVCLNDGMHKFSGVITANNPKEAYLQIVQKCKSAKNIEESSIYIDKLEVIE